MSDRKRHGRARSHAGRPRRVLPPSRQPSEAALALVRERVEYSKLEATREVKAMLLVGAINAAQACTRHEAVELFGQRSHKPKMLPRDLDWEKFVRFWVRSCMVPLARALRALEAGSSESVLPLLLDPVQVQAEKIRKHSGLVQNVFSRIYQAECSRGEQAQGIADLEHAMVPDASSWEQYMMWFEHLERGLRASLKSWRAGNPRLISEPRQVLPVRVPKKRGPKSKYDPARDEQISSAWESGSYKTAADLGAELGCTGRQVVQARDRHRKRKQRVWSLRATPE